MSRVKVAGTSSEKRLQAHQATLVAAAVVSLVFWVIPQLAFVLLPLQYLNTHLHEFSHAIVGTATGGDVLNIHVFARGGGVTPIAGGSMILTSSAGYPGATIIGGLMILLGRGERSAKLVLWSIGCILLFSTIFWVRGDVVGFTAGLIWMAVLFGLPFLVKGRNLVFAAQFLGMQQCLASVQSLYILLRVSAYPGMQSDADNLAQYTHVPAMFWALLWALIGIGVLFVTLRSAWRNRPAD